MKHILFLMAVISATRVFADVAPTKVALSLHPTKPRDEGGVFGTPQGLFRNTPSEPSVPVRMAAESVVLDVYPTLMKVHAEFWMEPLAGFADTLSIGFPEMTPDFQGIQLDELQIRVDGKPVTPELKRHDTEYGDSPRRETWWLFDVHFSGGKTVKIDIDYVQVFYLPGQQRLLDRTSSDEAYDRSHFIVQTGYVFRTGRLWAGTIGQADVRVQLHGLSREDVAVRFEDHWEPAELAWTKTDWEPESNLAMELYIPLAATDRMRTGVAPYDVGALSPLMRWTDAVVRFSRSPADSSASRKPISEEDWESIIGVMIGAARQDSDPILHDAAREALQYWRRQLIDSDWFNPAEVAYAIKWLNPDGKLTDEEIAIFKSRSPEPAEGGMPRRSRMTWSRNNALSQLEYYGNTQTVFHNSELFMEMVSARMLRQRLILWGSLAAGAVGIVGFLLFRKRRSTGK